MNKFIILSLFKNFSERKSGMFNTIANDKNLYPQLFIYKIFVSLHFVFVIMNILKLHACSNIIQNLFSSSNYL